MADHLMRIVIVGGGTAGWMTAASLSKLLGKSLTITLVESDAIGTVGVGEATIPTLTTLHNLLKINEQDFLRATSGTIKLGIQFEHWLRKGHTYFHSFGYTGESCWAAGFQHFWLRGLDLGLSDSDYGRYAPELQVAVKERFGFVPQSPLNYAYHLNATAYAEFLRRIAEAHGVSRIEGKVINVEQGVSGDIDAVSLDNGHQVSGDIFVDCSGFSGLLIDKTLRVPFEDYSHWLPCDKAIAVQSEGTARMRPFTRSIAHEAGWQWQIPLQHRVGNGLVYSSHHFTEERATELLLESLDSEPTTSPRLISFKTGQRRAHWHKNCVAIGLSASFIEPLESTSIHLISRAIIRFMQMMPREKGDSHGRDEFNRQMTEEVDFIKDFIVLHYHLNQRDEAFWKDMAALSLPERLSQRIALFRESAKAFQAQGDVFGENSWTQVMIGQGILPSAYHQISDMMTEHELENFLSIQAKKVDALVGLLPSHQEFLRRYLSVGKPQVKGT
jgi:tryptophan halogenase